MSNYSLMAIAIAAMLAGCSEPNPYTDADFGRSTTLMKAQQVANPDAARGMDTASGLDGKAVKGAMDNYKNSFKTPQSDMGPAPMGGSPSGQ